MWSSFPNMKVAAFGNRVSGTHVSLFSSMTFSHRQVKNLSGAFIFQISAPINQNLVLAVAVERILVVDCD